VTEKTEYYEHGSPVVSPVKSAAISRASTVTSVRARQGLCVLAALFLGLALGAGCSSKAAPCEDSKCASGERCVQDACRAACTSATASTACGAGQSCALWGFADGSQGTYCVVLPGSSPDAGGGAGSSPDAGGNTNSVPANVKCSTNANCDTAKGEFCVSGTCRLACSSHFDCQGFGQCLNGTDSDGTAGHYCDLSQPEKPGQFYTHCPDDTDAECDSANDFFCVGAGADDLDAYCTTDCSTDDTCAPGFACTPLVRTPCDDICGLTGNAKDPMCVPATQIGTGQPFQCAAHGVARNVCRPREFCSSCTSDADCLATANQICAADQSGAKICTEACDPVNPSCPWGSAATCGMWDPALGIATCAHRFGKCVGTGKSCEPCETDADCGPTGACNVSSFTGEHWCVDFSVSCTCNGMADANGLCTGGGCPMSPSGLEMLCDDDPMTTGSPTGICVGANTQAGLLASLSSPQTGCWPMP
jgi:hypothetical protein